MHRLISKIGTFKRHNEWLPIFIVRLYAGLFFILSGFFKIFDSTQHKILLKTLIAAKIPFPEFSAYFVPALELIGGCLLILGLLTTLASLVLFFIMITALFTDRIIGLTKYGGLFFLENFFYLPETLYALILLWLFFSGPGKFSLDRYLGQRPKKKNHWF